MISELQKIPPGWFKVKFGEIAQEINDRIDNPKDSGLQDYIGLDHLDTDEIRIKRFGSTDDVEATKFLCKKGDIIFGKRNAYLRKVAVSDRDAVVSAHSMVIRPKGDKIIPEFLPCFMQSSQFWKTAYAISEGSMSPTIKWKTLSSKEFWIPSKSEQKTISQILWSIEDNLEKTEKLIQLTEKLKKGLLEELLTKGIGHKKFKQTELAEIPEEWDVKKVEEVLSFEYGQGLPEKKRAGGEFPVIGSSGIVGYHDSYIVESPVIIVGRKGASGEVILCNNNCWPIDTTYFIKLQNCMELLFSYYLLKSLNLAELSQKGAVPGLNRNDVYEILVPIAPKQEQKQISTMINKFDNLKINFEKHLEKIKNIKKKLTNEFLSGKLLIPVEVKS
jgi:type I restriction enzyme, S subunit